MKWKIAKHIADCTIVIDSRSLLRISAGFPWITLIFNVRCTKPTPANSSFAFCWKGCWLKKGGLRGLKGPERVINHADVADERKEEVFVSSFPLIIDAPTAIIAFSSVRAAQSKLGHERTHNVILTFGVSVKPTKSNGNGWLFSLLGFEYFLTRSSGQQYCYPFISRFVMC